MRLPDAGALWAAELVAGAVQRLAPEQWRTVQLEWVKLQDKPFLITAVSAVVTAVTAPALLRTQTCNKVGYNIWKSIEISKGK